MDSIWINTEFAFPLVKAQVDWTWLLHQKWFQPIVFFSYDLSLDGAVFSNFCLTLENYAETGYERAWKLFYGKMFDIVDKLWIMKCEFSGSTNQKEYIFSDLPSIVRTKIQRWRKVWKSRVASSNTLFCDLPKSGRGGGRGVLPFLVPSGFAIPERHSNFAFHCSSTNLVPCLERAAAKEREREKKIEKKNEKEYGTKKRGA